MHRAANPVDRADIPQIESAIEIEDRIADLQSAGVKPISPEINCSRVDRQHQVIGVAAIQIQASTSRNQCVTDVAGQADDLQRSASGPQLSCIPHRLATNDDCAWADIGGDGRFVDECHIGWSANAGSGLADLADLAVHEHTIGQSGSGILNA